MKKSMDNVPSAVGELVQMLSEIDEQIRALTYQRETIEQALETIRQRESKQTPSIPPANRPFADLGLQAAVEEFLAKNIGAWFLPAEVKRALLRGGHKPKNLDTLPSAIHSALTRAHKKGKVARRSSPGGGYQFGCVENQSGGDSPNDTQPSL